MSQVNQPLQPASQSESLSGILSSHNSFLPPKFCSLYTDRNEGRMTEAGMIKALLLLAFSWQGKGTGGYPNPIENGGGLDYPKIHSRSITPLSAPLSLPTPGGMDLSPPSKRIKGFSPTQTNNNNHPSTPVALGRKGPNKLAAEFDHAGLFVQHGTPSASAAAAAVIAGM